MSKQKLTVNVSVRIPAKTLHKLDQMVEKYSAMNKREYTRSELIKLAVEVFVHNHYCFLKKPKNKTTSGVVNE